MPDAHLLAEERSIAYHQVIAARLHSEPGLFESIRHKLESQLHSADSPSQKYWAKMWLAEFDKPMPQLLELLVERSDYANQLRQSTPFAGVLAPKERWAIHRRVRAELENEARYDPRSA